MSNDSATEKYEICFVQVKNISEEAKTRLNLAFEAMESRELGPRWITGESCLKMKKKADRLFVLDPFEGKIFKHLQSSECRVIGPLCILACLQLSETLPKRPHTVYSIAMRRITISCSNLDKNLRNELSEKIMMMGGRFSKDLTKTVTHLIAGEVGSKKYHVAANFGLPIMLPSWVTEIWEHSQYEQLHAGDAAFNKFRCPIFKGLSITVSQFPTDDRKKYKTLIEENGGRYSGAMKSKDTTHLVLLEAKGDKYNFAKSWKLHCVNASWIDDSVKAGYCMDESLYILSSDEASSQMQPPPPKRSTPIKDKHLANFSIDCSSINGTLCQIEETIQGDISAFITEKTRTSFGILDAFDTSTLPKSGEFLDGCKIFLTGFKTAHMEKLRKIVNSGGGIRFSNYSDSVTHVICGEKCNPQLFEAIKASSVKPHVLSFDWLLLCVKQEKLVDEGPFSFPDLTSISPQKDEKKNSTINDTTCIKDFVNADFSDILGQYASQKSSDSFKEDNPIPQEDATIVDGDALPTQPIVDVHADSNVETMMENKTILESSKSVQNDISLSTAETTVDNLFDGRIFRVAGFEDNETRIITTLISCHGGHLTQSGDIKVDIAIVPLIFSKVNLNAVVVVTNCWLQKCIELSTILKFDENELFLPMQFDLSVQPLKNLIISISQYSGTERDCLMYLAKMLGAQCQDYFVRKASSIRGLMPNTHLIAETPDGSKYEASVKWNIPAVTKYWLLAAAKTNSVPPVEKYTVGVEWPEDSTFFSDIVSFNKNEMSDSKKSVTSASEDVPCNHVPYAETTCDKGVKTLRVNNRVKELIDDNKANISADYASPERFIVENFKPRFDIRSLSKCLNLTLSSDSSDTECSKRNKSLPISEALSQNLSIAVRNARKNAGLDSPYDPNSTNRSFAVENTSLNGVVVCVAKKLETLQLDINKMVKTLGGDFLWTFDNSCTHYVFQGKTNDLAREYRQAKRMGKKIVSPEWIYACQQSGSRVSEVEYPHTLKLRLSPLKISTSKIMTDPCSPTSAVEENRLDPTIDHVMTSTPGGQQKNSIDVCEQLDKIIVAAKSAKAGKRRTRMSTCGDSPLENGKKYSSRSTTSSPVFKNAYETAATNVIDVVPTEPSQGMPIIWDDPMGRMEREKIAAEVASANSSSNEEDVKNDDVHSQPTNNVPESSVPKKFMFSLLSEVEKQHYSSLINELGGEISNCLSFDPTATHLITKQVTRNEKFISSIASGKWVLHPSYIDDSSKGNCFLDENLYEWDDNSSKAFVANQSVNALLLFSAAKRWRLEIQRTGLCPFDGWKVLVLAPVKKKEGYSRILLAGGAQIVPFSSTVQTSIIKYAFVEARNNAELVVQLKSLLLWGIKCLKAEYLASYLIENPPPAPDSYFITECKDSSDESMTSKRRLTTSTNRDRKKSRLK